MKQKLGGVGWSRKYQAKMNSSSNSEISIVLPNRFNKRNKNLTNCNN